VKLDRKHRPGSTHLGESLAASARLDLRRGGDVAHVRAELEEAAELLAVLAADEPRRRDVVTLLESLPAPH
jgi:hypothetical protein